MPASCNLTKLQDSEQDVDKLIDKIETEGYENQSEPTTSNVLSFAKVWSVHKDDLDELVDDAENKGQTDSWAQALQKISEKQDVGQAREASGRGVRRKAARKVSILNAFIKFILKVKTGPILRRG